MPNATDTEEIAASLLRLESQIREVACMVENEQCCEEVLTQLAAVIASARRVGLLILEHRIDDCLAAVARDRSAVDQLNRVIERFTQQSQRA